MKCYKFLILVCLFLISCTKKNVNLNNVDEYKSAQEDKVIADLRKQYTLHNPLRFNQDSDELQICIENNIEMYKGSSLYHISPNNEYITYIDEKKIGKSKENTIVLFNISGRKIIYIPDYELMKEIKNIKEIFFLGFSSSGNEVWFYTKGVYPYPTSFVIIDYKNESYIQVPGLKYENYLIDYDTGDCLYSNERDNSKNSLEEKIKQTKEPVYIYHTNIFNQTEFQEIDTCIRGQYSFEKGNNGEITYNKYEGDELNEFYKSKYESYKTSKYLDDAKIISLEYEKENFFENEDEYYVFSKYDNNSMTDFEIIFGNMNTNEKYYISYKELMDKFKIFGYVSFLSFTSKNEAWYALYCDSPIPWFYIDIDLKDAVYKIIPGLNAQKNIIDYETGDCLFTDEQDEEIVKIYHSNIFNQSSISIIDTVSVEQYATLFKYGPNNELLYLNENNEYIEYKPNW